MIPRRTILSTAVLSAVLAGCSDNSRREASTGLSTTGPTPTGTAPSTGQVSASPESSASMGPVGSSVEIGHGPRNVPAVALTFHGAGSMSIARSVLGELRRGGAAATVLAVGSWLDADPAAAKLALDDGHELGNHTAHHLAMPELSAGVARREIVDCARTLRRLTGSAGHWFRASGTQHTTPTIRAAAAAAGYANCLSYDVDSLDWQDPPSARISATVMASVRPGSIVSMHLGHPGTIAAVPQLLDALKTAGLRPVTVSELLR
jgi:peptidoglycan/xylan/chitin deacetylase (PgdA/CDA1 family)